MKLDELMLTSGLDQSLPADSRTVLERIDRLITESIFEKDVNKAFDVCRELVSAAQVSGIALAKTLYIIRENWEAFEMDESFEDIAYVRIGLHRHTVDRYVDVWSMYAKKLIPSEYEEDIKQKNIKEQVPIAKALSQGYKIEEKDWENLVDAPDVSSVGRIVREVKGLPPRKSSLQIFMDKKGSLWAYMDETRKFIGSLEIDTDDEIALKAIERIINNAGIMKAG